MVSRLKKSQHWYVLELNRCWDGFSGTMVYTNFHKHDLQTDLQVAHTGFVVCVAAIKPGNSPIVPGMGLVSGSQDSTVNVWDIEECASVQQLKGHDLQVNAVGVLPGGEIVSGGMDGLLKMWKGGKAVFSQKEHSAPILCICVLDSGEFLTGVFY